MKKLPKRNGYQPKPRGRKRRPYEAARDAIARILVDLALESGVPVSADMARLAGREGLDRKASVK